MGEAGNAVQCRALQIEFEYLSKMRRGALKVPSFGLLVLNETNAHSLFTKTKKWFVSTLPQWSTSEWNVS